MSRPTRFPQSSYFRNPKPAGYELRFSVLEDGSTYAKWQFDVAKEGPPGYAHGGAVATVLDETMGTACFEAGRMGFTLTMTVNYRKPVPLETDIELKGRVVRIEGRRSYTEAELVLPDGTVAADATGIFIASEQLRQMIEREWPGLESE